MNKSVPILALLLAACATAPKPPVKVEPPKPRALLRPNGFELSQIDRSVSPCDDFYQYATGGWQKANPLPATYARYGRFEEVADRNRNRLREILEASAKTENPEVGSATQKLGDFWSACMNEAALEA